MKKLIIVIHCRAADSEHAKEQTKIAVDNGADGVFLIHHGGRHDSLLEIYENVRAAFPNLYMGLNFLGVSADAAYKALPDSC